MAVIQGSHYADTIDAGWGVTIQGDTIYGFEGQDTILGLGGDDTINGGTGNDFLHGGMGADVLNGLGDTDTADYGSLAQDLKDDDGQGIYINLATGVASGGAAEGDTLISIENVVGTQLGGDMIIGDGGANELWGLNGNDSLKGGGGIDTLHGGGDNDTLEGGAGIDFIYGDGGSDTAAYRYSNEAVFVSIGGVTGSDFRAEGGHAANDTLDSIENLTGSSYDDRLWGSPDQNTLSGRAGNDILKGFGGTDFLWGGEDNDTLLGGDGTDTLRGENGNDVLNGEANADTMIGGYGDDTYWVDDPSDVVTELAGQGTVTVRASVSFVLASGVSVENLQTSSDTGTAAINLTGNSGVNHITGNNGGNQLDGGAGADQMSGLGGNDIYFIDNANDSVAESGGQGADEARTSVSSTLTAGADVESLRTTNDDGTAAINLTGNSTGNLVRGNNGNNVINGGDGNDELTGRGGQDAFLFNTALNAATNVDVITDFVVADDTIQLDQDIFSSSLGLGTIANGEFVIGTAAQDANDRIIYNNVTGDLFFDADGNGATAAVRFANVGAGLAFTNNDFLVV